MSVTNHPPVTVVIAPAFDRAGNRRPGKFWARMKNVTFTTSATPFRDAAQYFLEHDVPATTPYTATYFEGGPTVMSATLGSVHEGFSGPNVIPFSKSLGRLRKKSAGDGNTLQPSKAQAGE